MLLALILLIGGVCIGSMTGIMSVGIQLSQTATSRGHGGDKIQRRLLLGGANHRLNAKPYISVGGHPI